MRVSKSVLFVAPLLASLGLVSLVPARAADPVVAVVNGAEIKRSQIQALQSQVPQIAALPMEMVFDRLLEHLIDSQLVTAEAKRLNLGADPEVKKRLAEVEKQVIQEVLISRRVAEKVTEDAVKGRYQKFLAENPGKEEVRARHILVEAEDEAKAVIKELKGGGDFAAIAKAKSIDPQAVEGGDLGYFAQDDMLPEFSTAAFALKVGEVSDKPVKTRFGWHVIKVEDKRMGRPPSYEEVREQIRGMLAEEAVQGVIGGLRQNASIKRFALDGSAKEGGDAPAAKSDGKAEGKSDKKPQKKDQKK